jgi:hypothetical protein
MASIAGFSGSAASAGRMSPAGGGGTLVLLQAAGSTSTPHGSVNPQVGEGLRPGLDVSAAL